MAFFAQSLPRLPSQLANQSHRYFRVRRAVVLQWLVTHNQYYHSVGVTIDTTALNQLPQDGKISQLVSVTEDTSSSNSPTSSEATVPDSDLPSTSYTAAAEDDTCDEDLPQSFAVPSMTEQETVQQSVQQRQSTLMWPTTGGMPLNEFTTEGYFTCAFPTLFPTGVGDFLGQRQVPVTIGNYFKHLMHTDDGRFARHPRFRFFALNTEMRHRALQTGRVYIRQRQEMASCPWMS